MTLYLGLTSCTRWRTWSPPLGRPTRCWRPSSRAASPSGENLYKVRLLCAKRHLPIPFFRLSSRYFAERKKNFKTWNRLFNRILTRILISKVRTFHHPVLPVVGAKALLLYEYGSAENNQEGKEIKSSKFTWGLFLLTNQLTMNYLKYYQIINQVFWTMESCWFNKPPAQTVQDWSGKVTYSLTHTLTHSHTYSFTHSLSK